MNKNSFQDFDATQFSTIDDLYEFVEANGMELEEFSEISDIFIKYRNFTNSPEEKQWAQWEVECFIFEINGPRLFSLSSSNGAIIGEVSQFPSLDQIQTNAFSYIKKRAENCKTSLLKARYYHLLWRAISGVKNRKYGIKAIQNYFDCINDLIKQLHPNYDEDKASLIGRYFENTSSLCNEINTEHEQIKKLANHLLFRVSGIPFFVKSGIVEDMLSFPKLFKAIDFKGVLDIYESELNKNPRISDFLWTSIYFPKAIEVAQKTKENLKEWHNEVGFANRRMADRESTEDRAWIKQYNYTKAIQAFTLAHNTKEKEETEQLYHAHKSNIRLTSFSINYDVKTVNAIEKWDEYLKGNAEKILMCTPRSIYSYLANEPILPNYKAAQQGVKKLAKTTFDHFNHIQFDKNKNIIKNNALDIQTNHLYTFYSYYVQHSLLPKLRYIIIPGIQSGHLTFRNFISFIVNDSWIGKSFIYKDISGQELELNTSPLIIPSIIEFFVQIQAWTSSKYYQPSFVLCIDSLTLKFEGLLRKFCEYINVSTSISRQKGMQELYINNILEKEEFLKYFEEDDVFFFKYLFLNEGGPNIRNNVAHSYYEYHDYSIDKALLLIAALLRIAKYDFEQGEELIK
ncbi:DUF4209 domain-containing protein [Pseudoflavitalea sp. G-6-1-2]|uniref:DUF4209 domain-containing protein n=1 Tax=Pseudoflavitalea sp. G-6-1-2 TaxID=2728841 RepID=UPI001469EB6D|nr:DUF4209 domain-containing protein [Pseudoflavitalea sp. G-6-1-2]NML23362.1 DUF4209 domain-containing protein [Pseudoflavitalea sp. G-6-1-2]